jgi:hypothetical protein
MSRVDDGWHPAFIDPRIERVTLAHIEGPGVARHIWMTFVPAPPEQMRSLWLEVFDDGAEEPSLSVPCPVSTSALPSPTSSGGPTNPPAASSWRRRIGAGESGEACQ